MMKLVMEIVLVMIFVIVVVVLEIGYDFCGWDMVVVLISYIYERRGYPNNGGGGDLHSI